jgi:hypothetical protein
MPLNYDNDGGQDRIACGYTLAVCSLNFNPVDALTYYFGNAPKAPTNTAATNKVYIRIAASLKIAELYCFASTAGTNENISVYVRKNNTTDTLIATIGSATNERLFSNTGLNISFAAGDYFEIKIVCPTWVTNPATMVFGGYAYFE